MGIDKTFAFAGILIITITITFIATRILSNKCPEEELLPEKVTSTISEEPLIEKARRLAAEVNSKRKQDQKREVIEAIMTAASEGKYSRFYSDLLSPELISWLELEGFKVEECNYTLCYSISW